MKWLVRGVALLVTCSIYTLLQYANFLFLGGIGAGLLTIALFGLGVWFIPNRIIRRMEEKKSAPPPPPPRETNTRRETLYNFTVDGQSICIPESQLASFQEAQERIQAEQAAAPRLGISSASSCLPSLRSCPSSALLPPVVNWRMQSVLSRSWKVRRLAPTMKGMKLATTKDMMQRLSTFSPLLMIR